MILNVSFHCLHIAQTLWAIFNYLVCHSFSVGIRIPWNVKNNTLRLTLGTVPNLVNCVSAVATL